MKNDSKERVPATQTKTPSGKTYMRLADEIADARKQRAINAYVIGDVHAQLTVANAYLPYIARQIEKLKKGIVRPSFDFCNGEDSFVRILTLKPCTQYSYVAMLLDDYTEETKSPDPSIEIVPEEKYVNRSEEECCQFLLRSGFDSTYVTEDAVHMEDANAQKAYYLAVIDYLTTAAAYAKGLQSEAAARQFVAALAEIKTEDGIERCRAPITFALPAEEAAREGYRLAVSAQKMLWADIYYRELKPLTVTRA